MNVKTEALVIPPENGVKIEQVEFLLENRKRKAFSLTLIVWDNSPEVLAQLEKSLHEAYLRIKNG